MPRYSGWRSLRSRGCEYLSLRFAPVTLPAASVGHAYDARLKAYANVNWHGLMYAFASGFVGALDWFGTQFAVAEREDVIYFLGSLHEDRSDWGEAGVTEAEAMSDAWLPFAGRGYDRLVVSCVSGRVFTCAKDVPPLRYVDDSIVAWLEAYAARVESGAYAVKKGFGDYYLSRTDGMH